MKAKKEKSLNFVLFPEATEEKTEKLLSDDDLYIE